MSNKITNSRRDFLSKSVAGTLLISGGISSVGALLQSFTTTSNTAIAEAEFRSRLLQLGTRSLLTAQLAQANASNAKVKMFATFEAEEQKTIAMVLKEMNTPVLPPDATSQEALAKLKSASGAAFDTAFMKAQVDTHEALKTLTSSYISSAQGKNTMPDMHTRHLASLALATITEHTARAKSLLSELK